MACATYCHAYQCLDWVFEGCRKGCEWVRDPDTDNTVVLEWKTLGPARAYGGISQGEDSGQMGAPEGSRAGCPRGDVEVQ